MFGVIRIEGCISSDDWLDAKHVRRDCTSVNAHGLAMYASGLQTKTLFKAPPSFVRELNGFFFNVHEQRGDILQKCAAIKHNDISAK